MNRNNVRTWMTPHPITINSGESVLKAYALMKQHRIRRLPVLDNGRLAGIITLNDVRSAAPMGDLSLVEHSHLLGHMPVERAMSPEPVTIEADMHVSEAARLMMQHKFGGLPVLEAGCLVGVLSEADIFRHTIAAAWTPATHPGQREGEEILSLWDGTEIHIRPITREDEARLKRSHESLSEESIYDRFMGFRRTLPDDEARYLTGLDYDRHMALVATIRREGEEDIIAVARYILIDAEPGTAEFAIVVNDSFQRRGLGSILMQRLAEYGAAHNVHTFLGLTHGDNLRFLRFVQQLGLPIESKRVDNMWEVRLALEVTVTSPPGEVTVT